MSPVVRNMSCPYSSLLPKQEQSNNLHTSQLCCTGRLCPRYSSVATTTLRIYHRGGALCVSLVTNSPISRVIGHQGGSCGTILLVGRSCKCTLDTQYFSTTLTSGPTSTSQLSLLRQRQLHFRHNRLSTLVNYLSFTYLLSSIQYHGCSTSN